MSLTRFSNTFVDDCISIQEQPNSKKDDQTWYENVQSCNDVSSNFEAEAATASFNFQIHFLFALICNFN